MKKRWTILLCTLLLCALCACGGQASQTEDVPAPEDAGERPRHRAIKNRRHRGNSPLCRRVSSGYGSTVTWALARR